VERRGREKQGAQSERNENHTGRDRPFMVLGRIQQPWKETYN
jgi:hypothetical protein